MKSRSSVSFEASFVLTDGSINDGNQSWGTPSVNLLDSRKS